ncbi:hypothetical protein D3H65_03860 [Paraflavitalea soli]|uniref:Uncharacterized protein n=1 Tax=Paraflavitalea soli TaxID=2315862 RepID=A0A3B7MJ42_9BACT|nr:hypothetical protein D3H65_03860 [Paraflavitalea soli]
MQVNNLDPLIPITRPEKLLKYKNLEDRIQHTEAFEARFRSEIMSLESKAGNQGQLSRSQNATFPVLYSSVFYILYSVFYILFLQLLHL